MFVTNSLQFPHFKGGGDCVQEMPSLTQPPLWISCCRCWTAHEMATNQVKSRLNVIITAEGTIPFFPRIPLQLLPPNTTNVYIIQSSLQRMHCNLFPLLWVFVFSCWSVSAPDSGLSTRTRRHTEHVYLIIAHVSNFNSP